MDAYYSTDSLRSAPALAASLRAVAEQLVPQVYLPERFYSGEDYEEYARQMTRQHLLAIADELEGVKYGTYRCNLENNEPNL